MFRIDLVPCIVPDATHLHRRHMRDIALEVIDEVSRRQPPLAVFMFPDGKVKIVKAEGLEFGRTVRRDRLSLVGVYDYVATLENIIDDLLAMERTH